MTPLTVAQVDGLLVLLEGHRLDTIVRRSNYTTDLDLWRPIRAEAHRRRPSDVRWHTLRLAWRAADRLVELGLAYDVVNPCDTYRLTAAGQALADHIADGRDGIPVRPTAARGTTGA